MGDHVERRVPALSGLQDIDDVAGVDMSKWSCDVDGATTDGVCSEASVAQLDFEHEQD